MAGIRRLKQARDELGRKDPLWAIQSLPDKKGNKWRLDEFFETGRREIQDVLSYLRVRNLTPTGRRVFDFGCGVGRLSQALAEHFDEVHGVDLSDSMIAIARRHNRHGTRCLYHVNDRADLSLFLPMVRCRDGTGTTATRRWTWTIALSHVNRTLFGRFEFQARGIIAPGFSGAPENG